MNTHRDENKKACAEGVGVVSLFYYWEGISMVALEAKLGYGTWKINSFYSNIH